MPSIRANGPGALHRSGLKGNPNMERRGATRFQLKLVVAFSWTNEEGELQTGEGRTRDLTSRGIYVQSETMPPVGAHVEMDVIFPQPVSLTSPAELHAGGRVVRIEQTTASQPGGFAAMNHTVTLRDSNGRILPGKDWDDFAVGRRGSR